MKGLAGIPATVNERSPPASLPRAAVFGLPSLLLALVLALTGCVTPVLVRAPASTPPVYIYISEDTWWRVDSDIGAASLAAVEPTRKYAGGALDGWRARVSERTEADFIPWFTSYWTQQWLAIKLAWYQMNAKEGTDSSVTQLATYLQEQYQDRVLTPVSKEIDPDLVREEATRRYIRSLDEQLQVIQALYDMPRDQFDRRLKGIPAIALAPPSAHDASLYQVIEADPLDGLPAYRTLIARIRKDAAATGNGPLTARISPMARRASEGLADKIAAGGGASAASVLFRGFAGMMISLGATAFGAMAHENERPELEALLRKNLNTALNEISLGLMEDRATGVMAGVYYISGQIDRSIPMTVTRPVKME